MEKIAATKKRIPPGLVLLLLAPILGELVSAHQTPLEFINPVNFLILSLPYGFGALICRELIVRWKKGGLSLLLLGAAYGIFEEAIVVYSIFDQSWSELGTLAHYGFFQGVNWTWAAGTIHFHTLISIGASVLLTELMYPEQRRQRWLGNKALAGCFAGLLLWIPVMGLIMALDMGRHFPPLGWYVTAWVVLLLLGLAAYRIPDLPVPASGRKIPHPIMFFLIGFVNMSLFFFTVYLSPDLKIMPLWATMLCLLALDAGTLWAVLRLSGNGYGWNDRHRLAFITGSLGFFIYFGFDKDLSQWNGSSIVSLLAIIGLWQLWRLVTKRLRSQSDAGDVTIMHDAN